MPRFLAPLESHYIFVLPKSCELELYLRSQDTYHIEKFLLRHLHLFICWICYEPADRLGWSCRWANEVSIGGVWVGDVGGGQGRANSEPGWGGRKKEASRKVVKMFDFWGVVMC